MRILHPVNTLSYKNTRQPVTNNSKKTTVAKVFVASHGATTSSSNGHEYTSNIKNNCHGFIVEKETFNQSNVPSWVSPHSKLSLSLLIEDFFNYPSYNIRLWGITGTKGKTTVSFYLSHIFNLSNIKSGIIGSIGIGSLKEIPQKSTHTTPEPETSSKALSLYKLKKYTDIAMEISSHSTVLSRIHGLCFYLVGLTNLDHDHLDFHQNIYNYMQAKKNLFSYFSTSIPSIPNNSLKCFFSHKYVADFGYTQAIHVEAYNILYLYKYTLFNLRISQAQHTVMSPLLGKFNIDNFLCSSNLVSLAGFHLHHITHAANNLLQPKGRLEKIFSHPSIFVDFAHTPNSLKSILSSLQTYPKKNIILIFGCGGNRDKKKRKIMTSIACKHANFSIITMDNPRWELPSKIFQDMKIIKKHTIKIKNRISAISYAINIASNKDLILIAGKGHEEFQLIKNKYIACNDSLLAYVNLLNRY